MRARAAGDPHDHGLLIAAVAAFAGAAESGVELETRCLWCGGAHGKPEVVRPLLPSGARIHASLSRSAGATGIEAVALSALGPIGLDVESVDRVRAAGFDDVALCAEERAEIDGLPDEDRGRARAVVWTRKEAVLKATGHGLRVDPRSLRVTVPHGGGGGGGEETPRLREWRAPGIRAPRLRLIDLGELDGIGVLPAGYVGTVALIEP
ncbi:4'-phosphopantetheinyl transferase superfamily protein [Compostimonas suwonensis]|uniref:4'-phosphopantetheinyl transferase superfamily protein n=1 Tax=Compostimonas suwonensis TaxID=1048394 RepID=A0A2M9BUC3_9MICO|nr:4'-phosphopantetheinyl transferase superfamily protein [Compostimonas suwonensis]